jgi:acyl-CoA:acyl-CoA alkyltransferase
MQTLLPAAVGTVERVLGPGAAGLVQKGVDLGLRHVMIPFMETHAGEVLKYGVELGLRTWNGFLGKFGWRPDQLDKVICHQVGAGHREALLKAIGVSPDKDFSTFEYLGNIGTASLPITAAIAEEREFLLPGDRVGFLGIGSGLNCLMLGLEW